MTICYYAREGFVRHEQKKLAEMAEQLRDVARALEQASKTSAKDVSDWEPARKLFEGLVRSGYYLLKGVKVRLDVIQTKIDKSDDLLQARLDALKINKADKR